MSTQLSKKISKQNQLHYVETYNVDNVFFGEPEAYSIPGDKPINFHRINIYTKNQDENGKLTGTVGDLILKFPKMFSFGVNANKDDNQKLTGHSLSLCMWSKEGVSESELKATELLESLIKKCKDKIFSLKKELKKPKMEMSDLKKVDKVLYWKEDEDGNRVAGVGPIFTPKLMEYKESKDKNGNVKPHQIATVFYLEDEVDEEGNPVEVSPLEFLADKNNKKYCYVTPAIKIDNIFIGGTAITIQCKIYEADVANVQLGQQRLLHPTVPKNSSKSQQSNDQTSKYSNTQASSESMNTQKLESNISEDSEMEDDEDEDNEL
jgi:hypothetical protein